MAEAASQTESSAPPYVAWKTFSKFVQHLKSVGVPNVVDRSTMSSMSGSSQSQLMAALRFLSLIQASGAPTPALRALCDSEGEAYAKELQSVLVEDFLAAVARHGIAAQQTMAGNEWTDDYPQAHVVVVLPDRAEPLHLSFLNQRRQWRVNGEFLAADPPQRMDGRRFIHPSIAVPYRALVHALGVE